jgi:hypothetical protein
MKILSILLVLTTPLLGCSPDKKSVALGECKIVANEKYSSPDSPVKKIWSEIAVCMQQQGYTYNNSTCPPTTDTSTNEPVLTGAELKDCYI